jgi:hypothetical protein
MACPVLPAGSTFVGYDAATIFLSLLYIRDTGNGKERSGENTTTLNHYNILLIWGSFVCLFLGGSCWMARRAFWAIVFFFLWFSCLLILGSVWIFALHALGVSSFSIWTHTPNPPALLLPLLLPPLLMMIEIVCMLLLPINIIFSCIERWIWPQK